MCGAYFAQEVLDDILSPNSTKPAAERVELGVANWRAFAEYAGERDTVTFLDGKPFHLGWEGQDATLFFDNRIFK